MNYIRLDSFGIYSSKTLQCVFFLAAVLPIYAPIAGYVVQQVGVKPSIIQAVNPNGSTNA